MKPARISHDHHHDHDHDDHHGVCRGTAGCQRNNQGDLFSDGLAPSNYRNQDQFCHEDNDFDLNMDMDDMDVMSLMEIYYWMEESPEALCH